MTLVKVPGKNKKHRVLMYALSTCGWCKRAKKLLKDNEIEYEYIDVDLCPIEEVRRIKEDILNRGDIITYPTIIVDDKVLISGFREDKLKKVLKI